MIKCSMTNHENYVLGRPTSVSKLIIVKQSAGEAKLNVQYGFAQCQLVHMHALHMSIVKVHFCKPRKASSGKINL